MSYQRTYGTEGWHFYSGVLVPQNQDTYLFCLALVGWCANSGNPPDHMWTYVGSPNMGDLICFFSSGLLHAVEEVTDIKF